MLTLRVSWKHLQHILKCSLYANERDYVYVRGLDHLPGKMFPFWHINDSFWVIQSTPESSWFVSDATGIQLMGAAEVHACGRST